MAKILIVDDRAINREVLFALLGQAGYTLTGAADGAEALAAARRAPPDLLITDVRMPGMDGYELARQFKADGRLAEVPVIFYTALFGREATSGRAVDHDSAIVLPKPSRPEVILATVARALHLDARATPAAPPGRPAHDDIIRAQAVGLRISALLELGLALASERTPGALLALACRGAKDVLKVEHVAVALLDEAGNLTQIESIGLSAEVRAMLGRHPADASFLAAFHPPVSAILSRPLQSPSRSYGWLYLAGRTADAIPVAECEQIATTLATQLALAWENAQREAAIASRERHLATMIESSIDAIVTIDERQIIRLVNSAAETMFGRQRRELVGQPLSRLIPQRIEVEPAAPAVLAGQSPAQNSQTSPDAPDSAASPSAPDAADPQPRALTGLTGRRADGAELALEASVSVALEDDLPRYTLILRDVTARRKVEADLRVAATAFDAQVAILVTDARTVILKVNRAFCAITGYDEHEVIGRTPRLLSSGRHDAAFFAAMWQSIAATGAWQGEIWDRRKNGEIYPTWQVITAVNGGDGQIAYYVSTQIDISDRKAAEEEIRYLAYYDQLTHLPNRRLLLDRLQHAVAASERNNRLGALLFIDLDQFKTLNDTFGHHQGDLLLQQVAQRLSFCVRESDTVARLGGDEFVVILEDLGSDVGEAANQTEAVGEKIFAALNDAYLLGGQEHFSTPSIGVTLFGHRHTSIDDLLKQADLAMYQAKAAGRNAMRFFDADLHAAVAARAAWEHDLGNAIRESQFILHYQPQVDAAGCVHAVEALVRWLHPRRGLVFPDQFIPLAEETGLILPLGLWVLDTACAQLARWAKHADTAHLAMAVNVSVHQLRQRDFVEQIIDVLDRSGADPHKLKLEVTESQLMANVEDTVTKMTALCAHGVGFALDDFGTGYSSLSYLKRLPFEKLKIDGSFVSDVLTDRHDAAIAKTIVTLTHSLGLSVIAEGVETAGQRDFLCRNGCNDYQGFLFSRPLAIDALERYLRLAA